MLANIIFDLILVGILVAGAVMGIKNGFLVTVARPVKFVATIAMAFALASTVGSLVVEPIIGPAISNKVSDILIEEYSEITAENANESLPTLIKFAASMCDVDIDNVASTADGASVIESVVDAVTSPVVDIISVIFGFIIAYFLSKIFLGFALKFINSLINRGLVGKVNRALGCIFSLFLAFVAGWALTSVSEFILNIPFIASADWAEGFTGGVIYRFFRSFTPLDLLLSF